MSLCIDHKSFIVYSYQNNTMRVDRRLYPILPIIQFKLRAQQYWLAYEAIKKEWSVGTLDDATQSPDEKKP